MSLLEDRQLLCQQVARLVFDRSYELLDSRTELPDWPSRLDLAWQVVRACEAKGHVWEITNMRDGVRRWHARLLTLSPAGEEGVPSLVKGPWARGGTVAEAICRAAVAALGK